MPLPGPLLSGITRRQVQGRPFPLLPYAITSFWPWLPSPPGRRSAPSPGGALALHTRSEWTWGSCRFLHLKPPQWDTACANLLLLLRPLPETLPIMSKAAHPSPVPIRAHPHSSPRCVLMDSSPGLSSPRHHLALSPRLPSLRPPHWGVSAAPHQNWTFGSGLCPS